MQTRTHRGNAASKLSIAFTANFDFFFQCIMEEIISGKNKGSLNMFLDELSRMPDGEKYRNLLEKASASDFNYYLANAVADIVFENSPAVEI